MSLENLATTIVNLKFLVGEQREELFAKGLDAFQVLELCANHRRLACGFLLIDLDVEQMAEHLYRSGAAYLTLLRARHRQKLDPYYLTSSFGWPLTDAIAGGAAALAVEISHEMPVARAVAQGEIEEDFCYVQLLMRLAEQTPVDPSGTAPILSAFERSLQGGSSSRFEVMKALADRNASGFDEALEKLLADWRSDARARRKAGGLARYDAPTIAHINIEGMALVRLAKNLGLATRPEYPGIPEPALAFSPTDFPRDATFILP